MATGSASDVDFEKVDFDSLLILKNFINRGAFGAVYGPFIWNSKKFAVKQILFSQDGLHDFRIKVEERKTIWTSLKHEHLIEISYVRLETRAVYLIMEYASGGSLRQLLDKTDVKVHHQVHVSNWARQIAEGMLYLHDKDIVHMDLKSSNIVLMEPFDSLNTHVATTLKITDFDTVQEHVGTATISVSGTYIYMAPEVLLAQRFSKASDVWSYGIVMWEMLTSELPHSGQTIILLQEKARSGQLTPSIPESIPKVFKELLCGICRTDVNYVEGRKPAFATTVCFPTSNSGVAELLQENYYMKVWPLLNKPVIDTDGLDSFWTSTLPYIIQRFKLWNGNVLLGQNLSTLMKQEEKHKATEISDPFASDESDDETFQKKDICTAKTYSVSKLDCIAYLVNTADCFVLHSIIRTLSQFHMSVPMIVPDFQDKGKYLVTVPILHSIIIKWEASPDQVFESHLFSSPFRLIVAVRLGSNSIGKSTILNQLMADQNLFSSCMEPNSQFGRPLTLEGTVEIVWLTQDTLSNTTWKSLMQEHYRNEEKLAILANLHGDASHFKDTIKYMQRVASSFLVFLMPDSTKEQWEAFQSAVEGKHIVYVKVDPKGKKLKEADICTSSLSSEETQAKVRCALERALHSDICTEVHGTEETNEEMLIYIEGLNSCKSQRIIDFVTEHGCYSVKQMLMTILKEDQNDWTEDSKHFISLCLDIFRQTDVKNLKKSFFHLENELSRVSGVELVQARREVNEANEKLLRIDKAPKPCVTENDAEQKRTQELELEAKRLALEKIENMSFGIEYFSRLLCYLYKNSFEVDEITKSVPLHFADLLIDGQAIELLNGDTGEIEVEWIKAIFSSVQDKLPNLQIFVMSIIGLQSTGKSTLLNALFSLKFAVCTGRCSRGLFMRMVFLDEEIRKSHGIDAIILIDSEGLCSPEKMNDPKASQKDRLMATLAFGISNLTIVNVLGESLTEMTEILQIAIVVTARLRESGHKPDMLLVQHLAERNSRRTEQSNIQFCESLNRAFQLIRKNDVEIASACFECLDTLTQRIQTGDFLHQFGPFKKGSSVSSPPSDTYLQDIVNLFTNILARLMESKFRLSFVRWNVLLETYWMSVRDENFALNFKNIAHITEFIYFQKALAKVTEHMESSFRVHKVLFCKTIREKVSTMITGKKETQIAERSRLIDEIDNELTNVPFFCATQCDKCSQFEKFKDALFLETKGTEWEMDIKHSLEKLKARLHENALKMLKQTFDGSLVRQECFFEFSDFIRREMTRLLKERPDGTYTLEEQKNIQEHIWNCLQNIAESKDTGDDIDTRMQSALKLEYVTNGVFPGIFEHFNQEISFDNLKQEGSFASKAENGEIIIQKLELSQLIHFTELIDKLIQTVLVERKADCFENGLDFEEGMVCEIRYEFPIQMKKCEEIAGVQLNDKFKTKYLQVYALQQLRKKMDDLQKKWDRENKPSEILLLKKDDYMKEIAIRLKTGFSSAGEGQILAAKLLKAIQQVATKAAYCAKLDYAKSVSWTTGSEAVRLQYFEELALDVKAGNKKPAIEHFLAPKVSIEKWYETAIDELYSKAEAKKFYEATLNNLLERTLRDIESSEHKADVNNVVLKYLENDDDQYFSTLDAKDEVFELFRNSIEHRLREIYQSEPEETADIPSIAGDPEIKARLGCTESCQWCGALCWGYSGHQSEKNTKGTLYKHHSCHQPCGLRGTHNNFTRELLATACHEIDDENCVRFSTFRSGMLWKQAKRIHFQDWLFCLHHLKKFDEMMRWFFQELNKDIAEKRNFRPATKKELAKHGCKNLNLDKILAVILVNK